MLHLPFPSMTDQRVDIPLSVGGDSTFQAVQKSLSIPQALLVSLKPSNEQLQGKMSNRPTKRQNHPIIVFSSELRAFPESITACQVKEHPGSKANGPKMAFLLSSRPLWVLFVAPLRVCLPHLLLLVRQVHIYDHWCR